VYFCPSIVGNVDARVIYKSNYNFVCIDYNVSLPSPLKTVNFERAHSFLVVYCANWTLQYFVEGEETREF